MLDCPEERWTQSQASAVRTECKTCDPTLLCGWLASLTMLFLIPTTPLQCWYCSRLTAEKFKHGDTGSPALGHRDTGWRSWDPPAGDPALSTTLG